MIAGNNVADAENGIRVTGDHNLIDGNKVTGCDTGIEVTGIENIITGNFTGVNDTDYEVAVGNDLAPVQEASTGTSPWANIDSD